MITKSVNRNDCNRLITQYSNLTHFAAGLFHLDPLGEIPQTTIARWQGYGWEWGQKKTGHGKN